jgi:hypothetical protein
MYSPHAIADDAAAIIKHYLGANGTTNVMSHDWGAMVHWLLMMRHPQSLRKNGPLPALLSFYRLEFAIPTLKFV